MSFSKDFQEPLDKIHFTAEGEVTFRAILFTPTVSHVPVRSYTYTCMRSLVSSHSLRIYMLTHTHTHTHTHAHTQRGPPDMFTNYAKPSDRIKLYVRRVFITDDFEDIMPKYLSFIFGVVRAAHPNNAPPNHGNPILDYLIVK